MCGRLLLLLLLLIDRPAHTHALIKWFIGSSSGVTPPHGKGKRDDRPRCGAAHVCTVRTVGSTECTRLTADRPQSRDRE